MRFAMHGQIFDISDNQLSGTLPTWRDLANTIVFVQPGNDGLCGPVSSGPRLLRVRWYTCTLVCHQSMY